MRFVIMNSISGFFIFCYTSVIVIVNGEEIDLIADLTHLENSETIFQRRTEINERTILLLNLTEDRPRELFLSKPKTNIILNSLMKKENFGICMILKQDNFNSGTIFSIIHKQKIRLLEIKINPLKSLIRIIYSPDIALQLSVMEKFQFPHLNISMHSICFQYTYHNSIFSIRYNCFNEISKPLRFPLPSQKFQNKNLDEFRIWIGQKNNQKGIFKGIIRQMIFSSQINFSSFYCESLMENAISMPRNNPMGIETIIYRLNKMESEVEKLKLKLLESKTQLKDIQKCQCFPLCITSNGEKKLFSETWKENSCKNCTCTQKGVICDTRKCPDLLCQHKITDTGKCCPRCGGNCQYHGNTYSHMENFTINCLKCHCFDGSLSCHRMNPKLDCPKLSCNRFLQKKVPGRCCKVCKKINLCDFSNCGKNAFCIASSILFTCQCKPGFEGNPYSYCKDINECVNQSSCPISTECINSPGSFQCVCKSGFISTNSSSTACIATCIKNKCLNNSTCILPEKCECAAGYSGEQCNIDIDECQIGIAKCPRNSECQNIPGSYICRCVNGFTANLDNIASVYNNYQCKDIDECSGKRGIDFICDKSSKCVNTPGGYQCISNTPINYDCLSESNNVAKIIENGKKLLQIDTCKICKCVKRNLICSSMKCNCIFNYPKSCCRRCYPNECNSRKINSFKMTKVPDFHCMPETSMCPNKECPNVRCNDSLLVAGQCCKSCRSDPISSCLLEYNKSNHSQFTISRLSANCTYNDKHYTNGEKFVLQNHDDGSCIKCLCFNYNLCCAKSFVCQF